MRFLQTGTQVLLAFSTILSGIVSTPVDATPSGTSFIADDAAAKTLSQRDVSDPVADDKAVAALSSRDVDTLDKRAGPPTASDFEAFFKSSTIAPRMNSMVFWSGTGQPESVSFAKSKGRYTLEMLIGDKWQYYQKVKAQGGYWPNWDAAIAGFWDIASQACARASRGEVYVYMLPQKDVDQQQEDPTRGNCRTCWFRKEKPALLVNLKAGKVHQITKYLTTYPSKGAGQITSMADKM